MPSCKVCPSLAKLKALSSSANGGWVGSDPQLRLEQDSQGPAANGVWQGVLCSPRAGLFCFHSFFGCQESTVGQTDMRQVRHPDRLKDAVSLVAGVPMRAWQVTKGHMGPRKFLARCHSYQRVPSAFLACLVLIHHGYLSRRGVHPCATPKMVTVFFSWIQFAEEEYLDVWPG